ncbi:MAG TPA: transglycosylase, partial [Burkholderiaceae bacterium]
MNRFLWIAAIVGTLAGCASVPLPPEPAAAASVAPPAAPATSPAAAAGSALPEDTAPLPPPLLQGRSRWIPVRWAQLPGFADDALHEAWNAWLKSCERPGPVFAP